MELAATEMNVLMRVFAIIAFIRIMAGCLLSLLTLCTVKVCFLVNAGTEVIFSHAGTHRLYLSERITFSCLGDSNHIIEILQIRQNHTIETLDKYGIPISGSIAYGYIPKNCSIDTTGTKCSKIMNITVTADMNGKSYQCLIYDRAIDHKKQYSLGGYITGKEICN